MYYSEFFRLREPPFSIAPNPRYLFLSERHREALAHLLYGVVNGNGFVALTGEVGTGKTTLCHCLLEQLPENVDLALILNPRVDARELLASLCDELRISYPKDTSSLKVFSDTLNTHLLATHARGRNTILLIDEAQNLSFDVLEQVRLLTNLETSETKLLQIILVGQPELNALLGQTNLRQLNQRITARYHIEPLSLTECRTYIEHRLSVSGAQEPIFSHSAIRKIYHFSGGIPRLINIICDRALLGAYSTGIHKVDSLIVRKAAKEVLLQTPKKRQNFYGWKFFVVAATILLATTVFYSHEKSTASRPLTHWLATTDKIETRQNNIDRRMMDTKPLYETIFDSLSSASANTDIPGSSFPNWEKIGSSDLTALFKSEFSKLTGPLINITPQLNRDKKQRFIDHISNPQLDLYSVLPQLFMQWQIADEPKFNNFCASARRAKLRCLVQQGTWHELVRLNRPATLEFSLKRGSSRYATLVAANNKFVTLSFFDEQQYSFPVEEILPYWQGHYALLWKPPTNDTGLLLAGYSHPGVIWLRENLPGLKQQTPEQPLSQRFDRPLESEVIAYQTKYGLKSDGKVGSETVISINNLSRAAGIPRLDSN